jgi:ABC-type nitrate/sulfonate/bicarbonate transport system permease component
MLQAPSKPAQNLSHGQRVKTYLLARPGLARLGVIILLLLAWEIAARFFIDKIFLSPPSEVFTQLGDLFETAGVPAALRFTFW